VQCVDTPPHVRAMGASWLSTPTRGLPPASKVSGLPAACAGSWGRRPLQATSSPLSCHGGSHAQPPHPPPHQTPHRTSAQAVGEALVCPRHVRPSSDARLSGARAYLGRRRRTTLSELRRSICGSARDKVGRGGRRRREAQGGSRWDHPTIDSGDIGALVTSKGRAPCRPTLSHGRRPCGSRYSLAPTQRFASTVMWGAALLPPRFRRHSTPAQALIASGSPWRTRQPHRCPSAQGLCSRLRCLVGASRSRYLLARATVEGTSGVKGSWTAASAVEVQCEHTN
jgi:hypothetical protein